ncbi:MAG: hypothetical protein KJ607_00235, partial [Bacteroidetes bacterium]|nr:hypothetical protein [Bacteroidota bacterium]
MFCAPACRWAGRQAVIVSEKQEAISSMLMNALRNDSIPGIIDTVIFILQQDTALDTRLELLNLYIREGMLIEAQNIVSAINISIQQLVTDSARQYVRDKLTLAEVGIAIKEANADSTAIDSIVNSNAVRLFEIALKEGNK